MGVIEVEGLCKAFGDKVIFTDVSFTIPEAETTAIIGPSGTGKSVLLKHLVGLVPPDRGCVRVLGVDLTTASELQLAAVRRRMGLCFQAGALFDSLTVGENVAFPLVHHARHLGASSAFVPRKSLHWSGSRASTTENRQRCLVASESGLASPGPL
jgi:phospholipid/cholesterol/gamma-HCH transport system ATP-binding protein